MRGNWQEIFENFEKERKQNTDAIADLAIDNYYEIARPCSKSCF